MLVDYHQHMHLTTYYLALAAPNCPTNYWWTETRDPRVRVAQRVDMAPDKEGSFPELPGNKTLPAASMDAQLDYAFYSLRKGVQARVTDQKLEYANIYVHWETRKTWSLA